MIHYLQLGKNPDERKRKLFQLIKNENIAWGGHKKAKIYGTLHCKSGKRMKTENRVFFKDEASAIDAGYRPCAHCLSQKYKQWRTRFNYASA